MIVDEKKAITLTKVCQISKYFVVVLNNIKAVKIHASGGGALLSITVTNQIP